MRKCTSLVAAVVLSFSCGPQNPVTPDDPENPAPGGIQMDPLMAGTVAVKIAVRKRQTVNNTWSPSDADGNPVACTSNAECVAGTGNSTAVCTSGVCNWTSTEWALFWVRNFPRLSAAITLPCDGSVYQAEVYEGDAATGGNILAARGTVPMTVATDCTPSPAPGWAALAQPALSVPTGITQAGCASSPSFNVTISDNRGIWASTPWLVRYTGNDAVTVTATMSGATATFTNPVASTSITFNGTYGLGTGLLLSGETSSSWTLAGAGVGPVTVNRCATIPLP